MRPYIFPILLAVIAIGSAIISSPTTADAPIEVSQVDLAGLHDQAASALRTLQLSQERRLASQITDDIAF